MMTKRYQIRDGIGFCRFEGRTIILDVTADRYWQLGESAGQVLDTIAAGEIEAADAQMLARLAGLGFVTPAPADPTAASTVPAPAVQMPSLSVLEHDNAPLRTSPALVCEVVLLAILARVVVRSFSLATVLARLAARRVQARSARRAMDANMLARRFQQSRRLLPLRSRCLPDSIAFLWFAMRRGHAPRLVFGVEAFPFTAHCWVQDGEVVLTDALDHVRRFKPILVL